MFVHMNLFEYDRELKEAIQDYFSEVQKMVLARSSEAGYAGDLLLFDLLTAEQWYRISISLMKEKNKWTDVSVTKLYGETFRADLPGMWWSREGYWRAMEELRLDPQIAYAMDLNFFQFYGRAEALWRLGLPPLETLPDRMIWRDYFDRMVQRKKGTDR